MALPVLSNVVPGSNVDRLFAIWQALYPDNFITPEINRFGTYTESPGTIEGPDTRMSST